MKNAIFTLQSSLEANYLNIQFVESAQLDDIVISVIREDCPEFLIPFSVVNINDNTSLKYKLINTIALEYCGNSISKAEFVKMYLNLLNPFINGNDWFLDYRNFCIDPKYVFLDKDNKAYFIYVPEKTYTNTTDEIVEFFRKTFVQFTIKDDADFQVRLYQYFSRDNVTLTELYRLFVEESKKTGVHNEGRVQQPAQQMVQQPMQQPAQQMSQSPMQQPMQQMAQQPIQQMAQQPMQQPQVQKGLFGGKGANPKKESVQPATVKQSEKEVSQQPMFATDDNDEVMQALFGNNKKKSKEKPVVDKNEKKASGGFNLFGKKKTDMDVFSQPAQQMPQQPMQQMGQPQMQQPMQQMVQQPMQHQMPIASVNFMAGVDAGDSTEISSEGYSEGGAYLDLIESPIPGAVLKIDLNFDKPYIMIGRISSDDVQPDVGFSREFTRIGRRHARIERRDDLYFVVDLGSANHTLLDGQILIPNQPYQLRDGGQLTFTDSKPVSYRIHL